MSATSNPLAIVFFFLFIALTLGVTYWAARRTKTTEHFYAAGHGVTGFQNGLALAGDYMSAASFLGIAGLVALNGFDGLIYSTGWLVGWPIILFLIAEPLRNLGKYTFSDVVAYRLRQRPVRIAAVIGTMAVVLTYLIAQMVGAGTLIKLLFNLDYTLAVVIVGVVMMTYVLFGGMLATTWVQIIKACLLLGGAVVMAALVLAQFGFDPTKLFAKAAELNGKQVLEPGTKVVTGAWDAVSLGLALMFGTAGLPHILMRFYTVPDAKQARISVVWATIWIGAFYLITFVLGFGAMVLVGMKGIVDAGGGGNMAAPLLANAVGGAAFFGFICAVAFATILAVVAGLTLSGAAALSHDIWVNVIKQGHAAEREQLRVARVAAVILGICAILLGIIFQGQNIAYMVGLTFSIAASANFPALVLAIFWRRLTTWGAVTAIVLGTVSTLVLLYCGPTIQVDILKHDIAEVSKQWWYFPLKNPCLITMTLSFLSGIIVSLLKPEPSAEAGFAEVERRAILGASYMEPAERAAQSARHSVRCSDELYGQRFSTGSLRSGHAFRSIMGDWLRSLSRPISDLVERRAVAGSEAEPLLGLLGRMREAGQSAALITDAEGRIAGLLTSEDFLERALPMLEPEQPVASLRRRVPVLHEQDRVYQAICEMRRQRRNCLPVADAAGRPVGLIRLEGLLGAAFAGVLAQLDPAVTSASAPLSAGAKRAQASLAATLMAAGEPAPEVIGLINALNDDIARSVLQQALASMAEAGWGEPPVSFAVLAMGSAGRGESLLNPDQDNGFILDDDGASQHENVDRFFAELAQRYTRGLDQTGFPLCAGDVMATNPLWRKNLAQWQAQVGGWVNARGNQEIMFTDIFFDFRAAFGSLDLAAALRQHVTAAAQDNLPFLAQISWLQHERASSVDLFGQLIAKDGPEENAIDLKLRGSKPLVEIVRLLALKHGISATGTVARIAALKQAGVLAGEDAVSLSADVAFLLEVLLCHQMNKILAGRTSDNFVQPDSLARADRERLVHVLRDIERWRQRLVREFFPGIA